MTIWIVVSLAVGYGFGKFGFNWLFSGIAWVYGKLKALIVKPAV